MPQVVLIAAIGAGLLAGYRLLRRVSEQAAGDLRRPGQDDRVGVRAQARVAEKDMGRLEYDPASGVYRPVRRD